MSLLQIKIRRTVMIAMLASSPIIANAQSPLDPYASTFDLKTTIAQTSQLNLMTIAKECRKSQSSNEIVVCAYNNEKDRLDYEILQATREAETDQAGQPSLELAMAMQCDANSALGCRGKQSVPISAIAITLTKAVILAINGDDWRSAFPKLSPNAYDIYRNRRKIRPR